MRRLASVLAIFGVMLGADIPLYAGEPTTTGSARYQSGYWTKETVELDKADRAATLYAEDNYGVGILIHLGQDVPNQRVKDGDELGRLFVNRFAELGIEARYFYWRNDAPASGITYHIGHLLYEAGGTPLLGLQTAWRDAPKVVEELKLVKSLPR